MCLYKLDDSIDELLLTEFRGHLGAADIVLVDPYPPLVPMVDHDHALGGLKHSKDVDQQLKSNQRLLQQVDYLRNSQHFYFGQ